jgi:hypothetical protein
MVVTSQMQQLQELTTLPVLPPTSHMTLLPKQFQEVLQHRLNGTHGAICGSALQALQNVQALHTS